VVKETGGYQSLKSVESTGNLLSPISSAVTLRRFRGVRINQESRFLSCPALFTMFPGRLARFFTAGTDSNKLQRSACAGSN
jgi:hypothetical protein